jgi:hypothetical protein
VDERLERVALEYVDAVSGFVIKRNLTNQPVRTWPSHLAHP